MLILCVQSKKFDKADIFVKYHNAHNKKYLDETEIIIKSIKLAGMPDYSKELEELLIAIE
ncbi:hypothetical protein [Lactobacillus sp.]|uniref:hypothetical protein n=1 Tax=Lactobacillus sp. TaxID=1591 RepID=UPI0025FF4507|nr:hypothetical protein [Lactobacillus sp.]MCO6534104.1 hypothetical protein [Lactobacillus sp.]